MILDKQLLWRTAIVEGFSIKVLILFLENVKDFSNREAPPCGRGASLISIWKVIRVWPEVHRGLKKMWQSGPRMTGFRDRSRDRPSQRSLDLLLETNPFFSRIDLSYDCRMGPNLSPIPPWSPHDEWGDRLKIKGKMGGLSPDAEKSMLWGMATSDV